MIEDSNRARAIKEIKEAISEKRAGIFVGAGASQGSGLPGWAGLLNELITELKGQPGVSTQTVTDCESLATDPSKALVLAQILKTELGKTFSDFIERRFTDTSIKPNSIHQTLVDIEWRAIVTTNYDRLIERAYAKRYAGDDDIPVLLYDNAPRIASNYRRCKNFILKAHGDARERPEQIVLTEQDYRKIIHAEIGYQSILQSLFTTTSFLFVGCSLSDPDLRLLLGFLHSAFHGDTPTCYALVPSDERLSAEDKVFFHDFSIHVVPIDSENKTVSITSFLKELL